ncbi:hypothetical protein KR222_011527, partial [Zaprionus bogoriensis]
RFFHRDQPPARTRSSITRNVYEFLSESQINDDDVAQRQDPAADIVKRMVREGRACAMMRSKDGKTRARAVNKKRVRPVGKRKQCSLENVYTAAPAELPSPINERGLSPIYEPEAEDFDESQPNLQITQSEQSAVAHRQPHRFLPEGAYSPLARTLLLNQTKTHHPQESMERRRDLLNMAKKLVSTPMNRKTPNTAVFSPQMTPGGASEGTASPWRVPDEAPLPSTFVFGLNTSQLPSYSSDFVRRRHVYVPDEPVPVAESSQAPNEPREESFFNDSNGENVPPQAPTMASVGNPVTPSKSHSKDLENENDENVVPLPNPRRTMQHRTPFKDINVLEVVVLPSWKKNLQLPKTPNKDNSKATEHVRHEDTIGNIDKSSSRIRGEIREPGVRLEDSVVRGEETFSKDRSKASAHVRFDDSMQYVESASRNKSTASDHVHFEDSVGHSTAGRKSPRNLFGFEDFISENEEETRNAQDSEHNITLNERLQRLKKLRPAPAELPEVSKAPLPHAYDDLEAHEPRQRTIKEMLCSTMIGSPTSTQARALPADESLNLFKDQDPEVTFDEKKPRRTYVRAQPKRKRKQRVKVLFIETDSSESENEQDSHDKSDESPRKAKRTRRDLEHDAKLQQFITSFRQECKEVEEFPLIVE